MYIQNILSSAYWLFCMEIQPVLHHASALFSTIYSNSCTIKRKPRVLAAAWQLTQLTWLTTTARSLSYALSKKDTTVSYETHGCTGK